MRGLQDFNENVAMIAYGDDNILSVSNRVKSLFDQAIMTEEFARFGMTYTNELKSDESEWRELTQVFFLKRGFRFEDSIGLYVGPLMKASIAECFNWIHYTQDEFGVIKQNFEMANMEFSWHDNSEFAENMALLQRVIQKVYKRHLPIKPALFYRMSLRSNSREFAVGQQWV